MDTRISLYKLEVLCEVVERGSVTRAAGVLGIAQPVVTGHIRSLEQRLGVRLFSRVGRGLQPTPAGEIAYAWARDVVARTRQAGLLLDAVRSGSQAELSVVTSINGSSNGIARATVRFQSAHPLAHLRLQALPTEQAVAAVLAGDCDYAVVSYLGGMAVDARLEVRRLADDELVLVGAPALATSLSTEHFASSDDEKCSLLETEPVAAETVAFPGSEPVAGAALASIPFVCTPAGSARRRLIDAGLAERGVPGRRVTMEVGSEAPFHAALRDGIGFGLLSRRSAADDLTTGRLVELPLPGGPIPAGIDLVWRRDLETTPLRRSFSRELAEELAAAA